jgi:hypothetical protein
VICRALSRGDVLLGARDLLDLGNLVAQAAALAARAVAAVRLDDLTGVAMLLDSLREAGLADQAAALAGRLLAAGMFRLFQASAGPGFRFGCEPEGSPAGPWGWEDLG